MGDPRLLEVSKPVQAFGTPELLELIADMRDTMAHLNGAGLDLVAGSGAAGVGDHGVEATLRVPDTRRVASHRRSPRAGHPIGGAIEARAVQMRHGVRACRRFSSSSSGVPKACTGFDTSSSRGSPILRTSRIMPSPDNQ